MQYIRPYSFGLMAGALQTFDSSGAHQMSPEGLLPNWHTGGCGQTLSLADSSSRLGDVVDAFDQQPAGWIPPEWSSSHYQHVLNLFSSSPSIIPDLIEPGISSPDIYEDDSDSDGSDSTGSTPATSVPTSPSAPSPESDDDRDDSFDPSLLSVLQGKGRKRIRKNSGVKPKAKPPRVRNPVTTRYVPTSSSSLEMVKCRWGDCKEWLHVDHTNVNHWGKHVREHYASEKGGVRCRWGDKCESVIHKSSMWKHVVVHEEKFKVKCPRGCGVSTRGDMMRRHLQSCNHTPC